MPHTVAEGVGVPFPSVRPVPPQRFALPRHPTLIFSFAHAAGVARRYVQNCTQAVSGRSGGTEVFCASRARARTIIYPLDRRSRSCYVP